MGESFGRINKAEAELTLLTLAEYFTKIGKQRVLEERNDVGNSTPYRAQVQYLKKLIKKYEFFKPYRRLISVNTVDGFQGQERDVILISLVRSNDEGQIGFLKDLRRMNVAMTRARMKLIILIKKYQFIKPYRRLISVKTVDGFQGQDRDVILISMVRSNDERQIGFLKDLRRMNVAMTRARMKLIILGNKDTKTKHTFYKKLWEYVEAINNNE